MRRREFLTACGGNLLGGALCALASTPVVTETPHRRKHRLISNHDGAIMSLEPPLTVDHFRQMVRSYAGTPVDTISWCVGDREVYHHDTKVAEVFGRKQRSFANHWNWRVYENTRALIASGKGPLATMVDVCREEGMGIFASVRMNSHYTIDPGSPSHSDFRRQNPELLIGHPAGYSRGSKEYGIRMGLNYARPRVRQHMAATLIELFERFEVDGVEMDFMRHPAFFKLHEAVENCHHMSDMLRAIRHKRDEIGRATGRNIELVARVPPTLNNALRVGLDVRTWMQEGLVDIVIAGGGFIPFDMPFDEFREAARATRCQVLGGMEFLRFTSAPSADLEINRAIAMRFWQAGADGLQLFNYFAQPDDWKQKFLKDIGDPGRLATLDKCYQMDTRRWPAGSWQGHGAAFAAAVPAVQLPVTLTDSPGDGGPTLRLQIADDLASAQAKGSLAKTQLHLFFENYTFRDKIEVRLNGQLLPPGRHPGFDLVSYWNKGKRKDGGRFLDGTLEYDVGCPPLRQGRNTVQVRLLQRTPNLTAPLKLALVDAAISYRSG